MSEIFDILNENGEYTNKTASRVKCHTEGYWHKAVVVFIISNDNKSILLQQRSGTKKLWPNLWNVTVGGHVLSGELGYQAVIRETKEELALNIKKEQLEFIGSTISENIKEDIINRHFNEYYIVHSNVQINDIKIQTDEVQNIKWFRKEDVISKIKNNYNGLTEKIGCWNYLLRYLEMMENNI